MRLSVPPQDRGRPGGRKGRELAKPLLWEDWALSLQKRQRLAASPALRTRAAVHCFMADVAAAPDSQPWRGPRPASVVLICLCPPVVWERAISGRDILQTHQRSGKRHFLCTAGLGLPAFEPTPRVSQWALMRRCRPAAFPRAHRRRGAGRRGRGSVPPEAGAPPGGSFSQTPPLGEGGVETTQRDCSRVRGPPPPALADFTLHHPVPPPQRCQVASRSKAVGFGVWKKTQNGLAATGPTEDTAGSAVPGSPFCQCFPPPPPAWSGVSTCCLSLSSPSGICADPGGRTSQEAQA